ncbi:MAG: hypothetical protein IT370_27970 [Deltaproteobacteria bacterium]|nr:hypothetical protein [Deltaproteobacteria bacterium]
MSALDPTDTKSWARAFARHVYTTGGPLRAAPKHAQRDATKDQPAIKTWADIGRRMFGEHFDQELTWWYEQSGMSPEQAVYVPYPGQHQKMLVEELCNFFEVNDVFTIYEACQALRLQSGDSYWTDVALHAIDLHYTLAIFPSQFQREPEPKFCSVKSKPVNSTWRRVA